MTGPPGLVLISVTNGLFFMTNGLQERRIRWSLREPPSSSNALPGGKNDVGSVEAAPNHRRRAA